MGRDWVSMFLLIQHIYRSSVYLENINKQNKGLSLLGGYILLEEIDIKLYT